MKLSAAVMAVACLQGTSAAPAGKICEERGWNCFGGRLGKMRNIAWNEEAPSRTEVIQGRRVVADRPLYRHREA